MSIERARALGASSCWRCNRPRPLFRGSPLRRRAPRPTSSNRERSTPGRSAWRPARSRARRCVWRRRWPEFVDDGDNLHVLPIVTRGPTENVNSLLYLRGIDLAIINSNSLEEYKVQFPEIRQHVTYLLSLFPSELHIFVRPEIQSLQDLAGKKVNFNTLGTAAAYSGPLIFSRLGINIEKTFIPHQVALQQMRKGEMAAVVFITSKPTPPPIASRTS